MRLPRDPRARVAVPALACLVAFGLVLEAIDRLSPAPHGPRSSSYATSPAGLAGYASVLERAGHPVRRLRTPVAQRRPRAGETLVVLDPDVMEPEEARAIGDWVRSGGRLVAGARGDPTWLDEVLGERPRWGRDGPSRRPTLLPVAETAGVGEVRSADGGAWHDLGAALPVIGPASAPLVVTARSGDGTVALIADPSPLQNRWLAQADDAAFGLALAGGEQRAAAFLETVHGYGIARGFAGLPRRVRWALLGLALTGLVALWAAGRRLGPPEGADAALAPARVEYVDALAAALVRADPSKRTPPAREVRP